jgi:very-short-patch-repair endonuclease
MRGGGLAYFADFVCRERRLVIELDGSQHADSEYDRVRDAFMAERGYRVLRFWNNEAMINLDGVLDTILVALQSAAPPHPVASPLDLSPQAGRGD